MYVPPGIFSSFITLLVTIGPIETAVVFAGLTAGIHRSKRISLARRSITVAAFVLLVFALAGGLVLSLLHISLPGFRVAGGVLLFLQALTLTFSSPASRRSTRVSGVKPRSPAISRFSRSPFR